jgi:hypothetical protein
MPESFVATYVVLWILVAVLAGAVFALYHHFGQMYLNSEEGRESQGPAIDEALSYEDITDVRGERVPLANGCPTLLAFMEVGCRLCSRLRPALVDFAGRRADIDVVAIVGGDAADVTNFAQELSAPVHVVADPRSRLLTKLGVGVFPFAVLVDEGGVVRRKAMVTGEGGLAALVTNNGQALKSA